MVRKPILNGFRASNGKPVSLWSNTACTVGFFALQKKKVAASKTLPSTAKGILSNNWSLFHADEKIAGTCGVQRVCVYVCVCVCVCVWCVCVVV